MQLPETGSAGPVWPLRQVFTDRQTPCLHRKLGECVVKIKVMTDPLDFACTISGLKAEASERILSKIVDSYSVCFK